MRALLLACLVLTLSTTDATAQSSGFGIGAILGEPTGLSAKVWTSDRTALTGAIAWSFREDGSLQIQGDYLIHSERTGEVQGEIERDIKGRLYFHYGIGGRLRDDTSDNRISARAPLGITYASGKSPLDFFIEVVPMLDFTPETAFDLNAAVGIRFYFSNSID